MVDEKGIEYTIQKGDTLSGIAKKYFINDWQVIYGHDKNAKFRSDNPDYNKIKIGDKLYIPSVFTMVVPSGPTYKAVMPGNAIFFDAHMHIQSNNCVPLPIQWGVVKRNAFIRLEQARELLTVIAGLTTSRFGQIGGYPTDKIAMVYTGNEELSQKSNDDLWKIISYTPFGVIGNSVKWVTEYLLKTFQTDLGLNLLMQEGDDKFDSEFKAATQYYFKNNKIERVATCLLMDLSYSHFWGNFGLPITLPLGNSNVFINDFIAGGIAKDKNTKLDFANYTSMTEKPLMSDAMPGWAHLFAKNLKGDTFSFKSQYYNFFEQKIIPSGTHLYPTNHSFIGFSNDPKIKALNSQLIEKEFVHIIDDLPKSETKLFEDYKKQKLRSIKAAMLFPLKMLLFFHYDPRRHFPKSARNGLLQEIQKNHSFYRLSIQSPFLQLTPDKDLNTSGYIAGVLDKLSDNESAYKELFMHPTSKNGVFWGVKMYPRLGVAPDNFDKFSQLHDFYKNCAANKIPITAHCSRGPLNIADYINYARYGEKNASSPRNNLVDPVTGNIISNVLNYLQHDAYIEQEFWFADTFTSAANWENVLLKYPELKIDLAHFGGMDIWLDMTSVKTFSGKYEEIESLINSGSLTLGRLPATDKLTGSDSEKKLQLVNLYATWIQKTAKLCSLKKNIYTDLACFMLPDKNEKGANNVSKMGLIAENLAFLIKKYNLKDKLLVGSDWYMAELGNKTTGVGLYFNRMFQMLRMVSKFVGFDAWHQFSVINPLKFLGLWIDGGKIDVALCEKYVKRLAEWVPDEDLKTERETLPSGKKIQELGKLFVNYLQDIPDIKDSKDLKNENNELLILDE